MNCATARDLLSAYVDGELPLAQATELADHLTGCGTCSAETETMITTVRTLREGLERHHAPDVLRARIRAAIREDDVPAAPAVRATRGLRWRSAAALLLVAVASSALTILATRGGSSEGAGVAEAVVASHIRSLMPDHLTDVRSSDQHNVKPWFNGRLDYSPMVPRLDSVGFPLVGGRLDYVGNRPVAAVVYTRRQHVINVFSWPTESEGESAVTAAPARHGYNVLRWTRGGVEYWVTSDLNMVELRQFVDRFAS